MIACCENCGMEIGEDNQPTRLCPQCDTAMCEACDCGVGTVCSKCEEKNNE